MPPQVKPIKYAIITSIQTDMKGGRMSLKSLLDGLPNGIVSDILSGLIFIVIGYLINEIKDRWEESREFRPGTLTALACIAEAEKEIQGSGKGKGRFERAVLLYQQKSGVKDRRKAEEDIGRAFNVSAYCHS